MSAAAGRLAASSAVVAERSVDGFARSFAASRATLALARRRRAYSACLSRFCSGVSFGQSLRRLGALPVPHAGSSGDAPLAGATV
jgi:hypothetical protein